MVVKGLASLIHWKHLGFDLVGTAYDSETALRLIESLQPHVVVSDIQLNDGTGLELIEKVNGSSPEILFILISGYESFDYCRQAISLGAVNYISKPVNFEELESELRKCLRRIEEKQILKEADRVFIKHLRERSSKQAVEEKLIHRIKAYIDSNYYEYISIQSISDNFFIGQSYFSELFKKEFGITFRKYLTRLRMEKAKLYIIEGKYKISDIAFRVGYDDPGYFSQLFRKHSGLSPREFRYRAER